MSLILEALRKSEAERRLGSAPDVLAAMPVLRARPARRRAPLVAGSVLALSAVLGFGWWWLHVSNAPLATSRASPATSARESATAATIRTSASSPDAAELPPAILLPTTAARTAPAVAPVSAAPRSVSPAGALPAPPTNVPPPILSVPLALSAPPPAAAPPSVDVATTPAASNLPTIADLSPAERAALPALKITMHVYADDPSHRFMIIDGQRVGEGARISDGVVLVHVRRDGAEIDARGRRLLLPKP